MDSLKTLKSLDLASVTIMGTAIQVIFSIIIAIILIIGVGIASTSYMGPVAILAPTLILGTLAYSVYSLFTQSFLYNLIAKRFKNISFNLENDKKISKISTTPIAFVVSVIVTIMVIIAYLIAMTVVPLMLSSAIQTLMLTGQSSAAYTLYNFILAFSTPSIIITAIIGTFIITFIYILIGTYIYNLIAGKGKGIEVQLSEENGLTTLESIDVKSTAIMFAIISLILGLITGIITAISNGAYISIISSAVSGFIFTFISTALWTAFYNTLGPRIGKIKVELVDE